LGKHGKMFSTSTPSKFGGGISTKPISIRSVQQLHSAAKNSLRQKGIALTPANLLREKARLARGQR